MKPILDVIVIGGGPCGSFTALNLAKSGVSVTVFEEHSQIGIPTHCAGHLSIKGFKRLGLHPLGEKIIENVFRGAIFYSPKGRAFAVRFSSPVTWVVNRALFDKYFAAEAEDAGAHYNLSSRVKSILLENGLMKGVSVEQHGRVEKRFSAKIVVDTEGISSRILRQTGLSTLNHHMLANAVHAEMENVKDLTPDMVEVYLGKKYAPGLYAWIIPKSDGKANVGLAVKTGNPKEYLRKLMFRHPAASKKLRKARILQTSFHSIPLGGPIPKAYSAGFLAVGDVASQVKPTTGGGVILGMSCAKIATEVICEALRENDFSEEFLKEYQQRCQTLLGFDMRFMLQLRKMLDAFPDDKIEAAISFCARFSLDKTLQRVEDMDLQGRSLLHMLWNPKVPIALLYFFLLHLL